MSELSDMTQAGGDLEASPTDQGISTLFEPAAETLRVLAHPIRLRMLLRLSLGVRTVGDLALDSEIQNHQASEHLRLMQRLGLVKSHRQGRYTYYRLTDDHVRQFLELIIKWFGED